MSRLRDANLTVETGEIAAKQDILTVFRYCNEITLAQIKGNIGGLAYAGGGVCTSRQPINHYLNIMTAVAVQLRGISKVDEPAIHAGMSVACLLQVGKEFFELALATALQ